MATAILDKLLQSQWGKSLIMWFFLALVGANVAQFIDRKNQDERLDECNAGRIAAEQTFGLEKEKIIREQIAVYQAMLTRLQAIEQKKKFKK